MSSSEIANYFDDTESRNIRDDLVFSVSIVEESKIAVDCGCGAGADINYLVQNEFTVYGFDIEQEAISRCQSRFKDIEGVHLYNSSFTDFNYPQASLVVADASLFFCARSDFDRVWGNIYSCLLPNGVFCGSFLGNEDTMATPGKNPSVFWPDVTAFDESEVRALFKDMDVLRFNTHKSAGRTRQGVAHRWHIFKLSLRKNLTNQGCKGASRRDRFTAAPA